MGIGFICLGGLVYSFDKIPEIMRIVLVSGLMGAHLCNINLLLILFNFYCSVH